MLFILLAYAAFHKETKFKLLYLETFSSLIFRRNAQHPLSFAQLSVLKLSMKKKKKEDFSSSQGVQKKHNKAYIFLFHGRFLLLVLLLTSP